MDHVVEDGGHGPLIGSTSVFEPKGHDGIMEITQRGSERGLLGIFRGHLNLVVPAEPVHKREHLVT